MGVEEPRLIRLDSDESEEHVLPEGETRIGRSRANAICLRASTVSRFHCYLVRKGNEPRRGADTASAGERRGGPAAPVYEWCPLD